jgi:hypothetical protein
MCFTFVCVCVCERERERIQVLTYGNNLRLVLATWDGEPKVKMGCTIIVWRETYLQLGYVRFL